MKKYEYVSVKLENSPWSLKTEQHREIIDKYAEQGWRYVGYIPTNFGSNGRIIHIDLIFEIEY